MIEAIILIIYGIAGYWAVGKTIWANKVIIYTDSVGVVIERMLYGFFLGFVLIPWALIKRNRR